MNYQRKYDLSISYNFGILPILMIFNIVLSSTFICCNYDKGLFIFVSILSLILEAAPFLNKKLFSDKNKTKLPNLENDLKNLFYNIDLSYIDQIFEEYNDYKESMPKFAFITIFVLFVLQFIIFILLASIKTSDDSSENTDSKKKIRRCSLTFHLSFGLGTFIITAISTFFYYKCGNRYSNNFKSDKYIYNITTCYYHNYDFYSIYPDYQNRIIEEYYYEDYPYLEEIYNIYEDDNSNHKIKLFWFAHGKRGSIFFLLAIIIQPIIAIISFILLCCFKRKNKCHAGFIVFEIILILLKCSIVLWPFIWSIKKFRNDLVNTNENIKHIIDDYLKKDIYYLL